MFIMFYSVFYRGFFRRVYFYLLIGWGKLIHVPFLEFIVSIMQYTCTGLPLPLVILSAGLSHKNYGIYVNDKRLA